MSKTALLAKQVPFDNDTALGIIDDYKLPKNRLYEWKSRGYIPGIYFNDYSPIALTVNEQTLTRSLFYWRVRLGLKLKDIAEWCEVKASAVSNWEQGDRPIKPAYLEIIKSNFQTLIKTAY